MTQAKDDLGASLLRLAECCRVAVVAMNDLDARHGHFHALKKEVEVCQNFFTKALDVVEKEVAHDLRALIKTLRALPPDEFERDAEGLRREIIYHFLILEGGIPAPTGAEARPSPGVQTDASGDKLVELPRYCRRYEGIVHLDWQDYARGEEAWAGKTGLIPKGSTAKLTKKISFTPTQRVTSVARKRRPLPAMAFVMAIIALSGALLAAILWYVGRADDESGTNTASSGAPNNNGEPSGRQVLEERALKAKFLPLNFGGRVDLTGAAKGSATVMIAALDRIYSMHPDMIDALEEILEGHAAADAPWRSSPTAHSLASSLSVETGLTVYEQGDALLPSEMLARQGGSPMACGIFFLFAAGRLGLKVESIGAGSANDVEVWAPRLENGDFLTEYESFEPSREMTVKECAALLLAALIERELEAPSPRSNLLSLFEAYVMWSRDQAGAADFLQRYRSRLLRLGLGRTMDQAAILRMLLDGMKPEEVEPLDIINVIELLGEDAAEMWWRALLALRPEYVDRAGVSAAERCADAMIADGRAGSERERVIELLMTARRLTPKRMEAIDEKIRQVGDVATQLEFAQARYTQGDRSEPVMIELARDALGNGKKAQTLSYLALLLAGNEPVSERGIALAAEAIGLAIELQSWDEGYNVIRRARERWPDDAILKKCEGIFQIAKGDIPQGLQSLRDYLTLHPDDADTKTLLAEYGDR